MAILALGGCTTSVQGWASARPFPGPILVGPVGVVGGGEEPSDVGKHELSDLSYGIGRSEKESSSTSTSSRTSTTIQRNASITFGYHVAIAISASRLGTYEPFRCSDVMRVERLKIRRGEYKQSSLGESSERVTLSIVMPGYVAHRATPPERAEPAPAEAVPGANPFEDPPADAPPATPPPAPRANAAPEGACRR